MNHWERQASESHDVANQRIIGQAKVPTREDTDCVRDGSKHMELQLSKPHDVANQRITRQAKVSPREDTECVAKQQIIWSGSYTDLTILLQIQSQATPKVLPGRTLTVLQ